jgi:hypothetical protein
MQICEIPSTNKLPRELEGVGRKREWEEGERAKEKEGEGEAKYLFPNPPS